ncbi:BLUF domain-containing protein [Mucilaginibacter pallidiroseus]|uniref:BLUF domain-containing protein n=1 Tax=Mucilaginibacter pallidiroseus TaxID=2599295 RepID=A0A563UJH5_9SPHI|nr:BLUF domain-containing protein [Mucilaginibacter pallidiroseus]TWR31438.1 BLUF domain-containing protein [Mucilaginibacter pallidiroseus]
MYYLVYISAASKLMDDFELSEILKTSRQNNKERDITGMLLYSEGTFMQVLEGEEHDVIALYNKIEKDDRHKGIIKLASGQLDERIFGSWSMGFKSATSQEFSQISDFANSQNAGSSVHPSVAMLKSFFENNAMQLCVFATVFGSNFVF